MDFQVIPLRVEGVFSGIFCVLNLDVLGGLFGQIDRVVQFHLYRELLFGGIYVFCDRKSTV